MKMDEQLIKSKKRFSSIWRRILHNRVLSNGRESAKTAKKVFFVGDDPKYSDDSECDKENSSSGKPSEEDLSKTYSCIMPSHQCLPTILKKSQTDPTYHHSSERHATFKEIVKVHEYVIQDSIENEEHYTSETSLTDDEEHVPSRKGFYVDNYPDQDGDDEGVPDEAPRSFDTKKLISDAERANIFRKLDGSGDVTEDSDEASAKTLPEKSKNKKPSKSKPKKKKVVVQEELQDVISFDFGC